MKGRTRSLERVDADETTHRANRKLKLLLVEDDEVDRMECERYLAQDPATDYVILRAATAQGAIEAADAQPPDCVLLDYVLPDRNGLDLARELCSDHGRASLPVVMVTGQGNENVAVEAMKIGACDYLVKGEFDAERLSTAIHHALEHHRLAQELEEARRRSEFLATHCSLTALPNRYLLHDRLAKALASARRSGRRLAVLVLDLDRFKSLNDTLGHFGGDEILRTVARRLCARLRGTDTVARLGGDEFAIVLTELPRPDDAGRVAEQLNRILAEGIFVRGREFVAPASVGIAIYPDDGADANALLCQADIAMYQAKRDGGNSYRFFSEQMNRTSLELLEFETQLRRSVDREELLLHYQPKVEATTGSLVGIEALVRWRHPELGMVPPGRFIPIAEETGFIAELGDWVIANACRQLRQWQDAGLQVGTISVNVSNQQFWQPGFEQKVESVLEKTGIESTELELEITESCLARDPAQVGEVMKDLKRLGVRFSLDDFGTGFSSLSALQILPLDAVKIDRSFIAQIGISAKGAAIVDATILLARSLGLDTVAEGVETESQLEFLLKRGCSVMQGFLFSPPLPVEETARVLTARRLERKPGHSTAEKSP